MEATDAGMEGIAMFEPAEVRRQIYGDGTSLLLLGDVARLPKELREKAGTVQCVYADPPFMTGESYGRTRVYGPKGWRRGSPALKLPGYSDQFADERAYLRFLRRLIQSAKLLLRSTGVFYLHLDWRMAARARLLCDEIFGRDMFLNEIIWSYESGGRSKKCFSRKHDTILMYARSRHYQFDITRVPLDRRAERKNHMARGIDEDGRAYSRIVSGGREYRYYDDEPVYPGDVWDDIGHLQQRDPERTGYPTQKPVKLLRRLLLPVTQPGDWVADLCCGSGTTLVAAQELGCPFLGMDREAEALTVSLSRLRAENLTLIGPTETAGAELLAGDDPEAGRFRMAGLRLAREDLPAACGPLEVVEAWETGTLQRGVFRTEQRFQRSWKYPELVDSLTVPPESVRAVVVTDALGARRAFVWKPGKA